MDVNTELKLAVLIDADNIPYANIKGMMEEIAKYGTPTFKRIYGDWTRPSLSGWKGVLLENAITPIQQYSYTKGKNSTDSALIIDAMDILYTGQVDGFCIISSDSDFTRLATRLREAGKKVFGMGERKTPISFIASCNKFIYLEILPGDIRNAKPVKVTTRGKNARVNETAGSVPDQPQVQEKPIEPTASTAQSRNTSIKRTNVKAQPPVSEPEVAVEKIEETVASKPQPVVVLGEEVIRLITGSINALAEEDGWVGLSTLGALIMKRQPDFDSRNYGFKKLIELVKNIPQIEIDKRETGKNNVSHFYVRLREGA